MMNLCSDLIAALQGRTLCTAESCTGGMIGAALTSVPGSSLVFKGGIISYTNEVKNTILNVSQEILDREGAVSAPIAEAMAVGARLVLNTDLAISVTGLAGPGGDDYGNPVGTVYIGYADKDHCCSEKYHFDGDREAVRRQAAVAALKMLKKRII